MRDPAGGGPTGEPLVLGTSGGSPVVEAVAAEHSRATFVSSFSGTSDVAMIRMGNARLPRVRRRKSNCCVIACSTSYGSTSWIRNSVIEISPLWTHRDLRQDVELP